jgi:hypothetical protein
MLFKNIEVNTGDIVSLQASSVPLSEVQGTVIDVKEGVLETMSTLLAPFKHSGLFNEDEVSKIKVICSAEIAIPRESGGKGFTKGAYVATQVEGKGVQTGRVVAAFDGVVVAQREGGEFIVGGSSFFEKIPKWRMIDMKMMNHGHICELVRVAKITKKDVQKFYVMNKDGKGGQIMTYEKMFALDIDQIGGWYRIGQLDVNC